MSRKKEGGGEGGRERERDREKIKLIWERREREFDVHKFCSTAWARAVLCQRRKEESEKRERNERRENSKERDRRGK